MTVLNAEVNRAQGKLDDFQKEVGSKLEGELLNGINKLFQRKKDK